MPKENGALMISRYGLGVVSVASIHDSEVSEDSEHGQNTQAG